MRRRPSHRAAVLAVALSAIGVVGARAAGVAPPPGGDETIALSTQVAKGAITLVGADGRGVRPLVVGASPGQQLLDPAWGPSGSVLVYTSAHPPSGRSNATAELWSVAVPNGVPRALTAQKSGRIDGGATFSPLGTEVAFSRGSVGIGTPARIFVVPASGGSPRAITSGTLHGHNVVDTQPAWSPGGTTIAFTRRIGRRSSIWVMHTNGSGQRQLIANALDPAWSPDGSRIAFVSPRARHGRCGAAFCNELYVATSGGLLVTRITHDTLDESGPAWSPDGSRIAVIRGGGGSGTPVAFTMSPSGACPVRVTNAIGVNAPAWRPGLSAPAVTC